MKKLFLSLILVVLSSVIVSAQVWHPTNQVTLAWDTANMATGYKVFTINLWMAPM